MCVKWVKPVDPKKKFGYPLAVQGLESSTPEGGQNENQNVIQVNHERQTEKQRKKEKAHLTYCCSGLKGSERVFHIFIVLYLPFSH